MKRVGWFEIAVAEVADRPPEDGYTVALVGQDTLDRIGSPAWRDAIGVSPVLFNTRGMLIETSEVRRQLLQFTTVCWHDVASVAGVARLLMEARDEITKVLNGANGEVRVVIDANSMPKALFAALLGMLIRTRIAAKIDVLYQSFEYLYRAFPLNEVFAGSDFQQDINDVEFLFSAVPYAEGKYKSALGRHIIMLCGLDYQRTMAKLLELEPARVDIVLESEAIALPTALPVFQKCCRHIDVDPDRVPIVGRTDLDTNFRAIESALMNGRDEGLHSIIIASSGKPATLAATLFSVLQSETPLLVTIPDRVVELEARANGPMLLYRLTDRTAIA
ncbi:hypothetical protein AAFG13_36845 [Bradyrhizobium sp. B124]|uniref:hypothetical protein n=1 Tax=Bradyrhizobium sp. B124 TaxID=3140245 RepID=UPI00318375C8